MTETTTATEAEATREGRDWQELFPEDEAPAKSLATMRPDQQRFDEQQVAILRQLGVEDATQGDLDLFFHVCRTTGLDPFRKQIYMIGRNTKVTEWVDTDSGGRRKEERWVTKYTIQTGIDGYRRNGREAAKRLGDELAFEGPLYTGENDFTILPDGTVVQHWREVWPKGSAPHAAKYTITRNGERFSAVVHYDEFVQTKSDGSPNAMWTKAPRNMTAKCAEAMAWRHAYPDDFAGLILEGTEQPTIIDQDGNVESEAHRPEGRGVGGMRAARERREQQRQQADNIIDAETTDDGTSGEAGPDGNWTPEARRKGLGRMHQLFGKGDLPKDAREDRLIVTSKFVGRAIASANELTDYEIGNINFELDKLDRAGELGQFITDVLNENSLKQAEAAEAAAEENATATTETEGN